MIGYNGYLLLILILTLFVRKKNNPYLNLDIYFGVGRKWFKLDVYFDEIQKWIFFLGQPTAQQPLTYVLPISSDEPMTTNDLFTLKSKLSSTLPSTITNDIQR
jgi:hypothetical protein